MDVPGVHGEGVQYEYETAATPDVASEALAVRTWSVRMLPGSAPRATLLGVLSMRMAPAAVWIGSGVPTLSAGKNFPVETPSAVSGIEVPAGDAVVGVLPSVVEYVFATPDRLSVGVNVTV